MLLSKAEVCDLCGLPPTTLQRWIEDGVVVPAERNGLGRGNGARFTVMQAVGLAVAAELRRAERGCCQSYVGQVVAAFGAMTVEQLGDRFKEGETHLVMIHQPFDPPGVPILRGQDCDRVDVKATCRDVAQAVADIEQRLRDQPAAGRVRGLAGSGGLFA